METRRLIIALVLSMLVLWGWGALFPPKKPAAAPLEKPSAMGSAEPEAAAAGSPAPATAVEVPRSVTEVPSDGEASPPVSAANEESLRLEAEDFVAEFSNRGAQMTALRLKGHLSDDGTVLDLVRHRAEGPYPFGLTSGDGKVDPVNGALFLAQETGDGPDRAITFQYRGPLGEVEKRFSLGEKGLLSVEVHRRGTGPWGLLLGPGLGNPSAQEAANKLVHRRAGVPGDGKVVREDARAQEEALRVSGGRLAWAGLDSNYFATVLLPQTHVEQVVWTPVLVAQAGPEAEARFQDFPDGGQLTKEQKALGRELWMRVDASGEEFKVLAFLGAKQLDRLSRVGMGLDQTIELGWFRFLALPFMHALRWIHDHVVQNYGWAIVLMTVLIKILLLPLTHKTMVSMSKMQDLNPKQQAIRARYAGKLRDKQGRMNFEAQRKMNEEVMELYKKEGVNPAGGCLPLVLQLPVFIAFYNILPASVELRHAPWIFWVHDLAAHDPYYILPIVMGGTQLIQQLMVPAMGNTAQRNMMLAMPVVFTFLFAGFPAGLVLYWLTNNVLSIIQQAAYNKWKKGLGNQVSVAGQT